MVNVLFSNGINKSKKSTLSKMNKEYSQKELIFYCLIREYVYNRDKSELLGV
jgi:hypothetical protein